MHEGEGLPVGRAAERRLQRLHTFFQELIAEHGGLAAGAKEAERAKSRAFDLCSIDKLVKN